MSTDRLGRPIELRDYDAKQVVGVRIDSLGDKIWVCVDGACVLRVNAPAIEFTDDRLPRQGDRQRDHRLPKQEDSGT